MSNNTITEEDYKKIKEVLLELKTITQEYSSCFDLSQTEFYDSIKKRLTAQLEFLSSYKELLNEVSTYKENEVKKEVYASIISKLVNGKKIGVTAAKIEVENVSSFKEAKRDLIKLVSAYNVVKTKYSFYMEILKLVVQSVSTSVKEYKNNKLNK